MHPPCLENGPEVISIDKLETVKGGFDIAGLAGSIGGLVDQFAGTGGKASQIAGQIGGIAQSFMGGGK